MKDTGLTMQKYQWSRLTKPRLGRYAEYFVKLALTLHGFDVYSPELDDQGIDFVVCEEDQWYYDVQVKPARGLNYILFAKDKFVPRENLRATAVLFTDGDEPALYLVPSTAWLQPKALFAGRNYEGKKSKSEWGLNLSQRQLHLLKELQFAKAVRNLLMCSTRDCI